MPMQVLLNFCLFAPLFKNVSTLSVFWSFENLCAWLTVDSVAYQRYCSFTQRNILPSAGFGSEKFDVFVFNLLIFK
jgi:hypothetical protein